MGYSAAVVAARFRAAGWRVTGTGRSGTIAFEDDAAVLAELRGATAVLSSVPPDPQAGDPVLARYGAAICAAPALWIGYLSSTGVYGDTGGAWVDESAPLGKGRRAARTDADMAWQGLRDDVRIFRLPGIYGPGRSAIDRVIEGRAHRVSIADQVFSRVHVDDIAGAVFASIGGPPGVYNIADDLPCDQNRVIAHAAALIGRDAPPMIAPDDPSLSPMARAFYAENRRVANGRAKRLLGWRPAFPTYVDGLRDCRARISPTSDSAAPAAAIGVQR